MNGPERQDRTAVLVGLSLLLLPLILGGLWFRELGRAATPEDRAAAFLGYFPPFARREGLLALSALLLSGASGFFLVRGALSTRGFLRFLAIVGVFVSLALCLLNAWQLL
jgi:hypothetical protein